jgi:hypothetical protein
MNDSPPSLPQPAFDIVKFAGATRFALVSIVFCLAYFGVSSSLSIGHFEQIFRDMLGGKPLPTVTQWIIHFRLLILLISLLVPLIALATLFLSNLARAVTILGWLVIISFVQCLTIYQGLVAPFLDIMKALGGTP